MSITAAPNQTHLNTGFSIISRMFQANAQSFEKAIAGIPEDHWLLRTCPRRR